MSLIPSESYSFPDHFTSTRAASPKPKNVEPQAEAVETLRKKPAIVLLPNPEPHSPPVPVVSHPNPVLRRANAAPPRTAEPPGRRMALPPTLKPKVRWNNRAPAMNPAAPTANNGSGNGAAQTVTEVPPMPARNVIQMRPPPALVPRAENVAPENPRPIVQPRTGVRPENLGPQNQLPIPRTTPIARTLPPAQKSARAPQPRPISSAPTPMAAATSQSDFFEMFAQIDETIVVSRRKEKMRRFIICESIAVGVFLPLVLLGLFFQPQNAGLHWIMNIFTISAAVAAALIPIIFFAIAPTLPEIER